MPMLYKINGAEGYGTKKNDFAHINVSFLDFFLDMFLIVS